VGRVVTAVVVGVVVVVCGDEEGVVCVCEGQWRILTKSFGGARII